MGKWRKIHDTVDVELHGAIVLVAETAATHDGVCHVHLHCKVKHAPATDGTVFYISTRKSKQTKNEIKENI